MVGAGGGVHLGPPWTSQMFAHNNIIIVYNLYRGKAPVTGSDFQGGPLRVKIKIH